MGEADTLHGNPRTGQRLADHGKFAAQERVAALYETHREAIYRFLLMRGLEPSTAQDVAQDTFIQLFLSLSNGTVIESERAWLFSVAARSAVNHWRREGRSSSVPLDAAPEIAGI